MSTTNDWDRWRDLLQRAAELYTEMNEVEGLLGRHGALLVKTHREFLGMSLRDFAEIVGVSHQGIKLIETGKQPLRIGTAWKLFRHFDEIKRGKRIGGGA